MGQLVFVIRLSVPFHESVSMNHKLSCSKQQVWCGTLRYGTSKYSRVNTSRADAVSLQVVQCIAERDMLCC